MGSRLQGGREDRPHAGHVAREPLRILIDFDCLPEVASVVVAVRLLSPHPRVGDRVSRLLGRDSGRPCRVAESVSVIELDECEAHQAGHLGGDPRETASVGGRLTARVPASKVIGSCFKGLGCLNEQEFVVAGGQGQQVMAVANSKVRYDHLSGTTWQS